MEDVSCRYTSLGTYKLFETKPSWELYTISINFSTVMISDDNSLGSYKLFPKDNLLNLSITPSGVMDSAISLQ